MDITWFETILKKDDWLKSVAKVVDIKSENAISDGENFASKVSRYYIKILLNSGEVKTKRFIFKHSSDFDFMNKEYSLFLYEIKTYEVVLNSMERLMDEFNDRRSKLWCQMLTYNPYDMIALEDLSALGYVVAERTKCLDLEHSFLVLKSIGRFHAMSKILVDREIVSREDFPSHFFVADSRLSKALREGCVKSLGRVMAHDWPEEMKEIGLRIASLEKTVHERFRKIAEVQKNGFNILNHGDQWTCNLMFKYHEGSPISLKFVDFQRCHFNSYMWDFLFFVYSSVVPKIRRAHMDDLLEVYLNSLRDNLEYYGFKGEAPSFSEAQREAERLDFLSFYLIGATYSITTTEVTNSFGFDQFLKNEEDVDSLFNTEVWKAKKYIDDTIEDFKGFAQKGTI